MGSTFIGNIHIVRGVPTDEQMAAPFANLPPGARVRWRCRSNDWATCFVKTADGIAKYYPEFIDGKWVLNDHYRYGVNLRIAA